MPAVVDPRARASALLRVDGVSVTFGEVKALQGVDLQIKPGELVALAGENGAGKSTLARCIAGEIQPDAGSVHLSGRALSTRTRHHRRDGIAVVWQDLALCDNLDVAANIELGTERRWLASPVRTQQRVAGLLAELGIQLADTTRRAGSLSGGQRQMLAMARAMRDDPDLLILDEPTAALDVNSTAQLEALIRTLRRRGTTILLISHDIDQVFRVADRIAVLRNGRIIADVDPGQSHPDELAAIMSGQELDYSARHQLNRLQRLSDTLVSAEPSSVLSLILSALGAALGTEQVCLHLLEEGTLVLVGAIGLPPVLVAAWAELPLGPGGGPAGQAAATQRPASTTTDTPAGAAVWSLVRPGQLTTCWSVPVAGTSGLAGVITVFRPGTGPNRDEIDLVTLYAGYATNAIERDRLLTELTARNSVLETIREVLETLAGPLPVASGIAAALASLQAGLGAAEIGLFTREPGKAPEARAHIGAAAAPLVGPPLVRAARSALGAERRDGLVHAPDGADGGQRRVVSFASPAGPAALVARWVDREVPGDAIAVLEDAANSLRLALEREDAERARQQTAAMRRSQELQQQFLSRLSHELRTPLTAIRGYADTLMQPDVIWDDESRARFLHRIAVESARLGRLVEDLLDFSAIESNVLRLQPDWCDLGLVLDAARACLSPQAAARVRIDRPSELPVVWADHDRLEQVFVNLMDNAVRHNPDRTAVSVTVGIEEPEEAPGEASVVVNVADNGAGMPAELARAPFEPRRRSIAPTAGSGLGLSIAKGIIDAHGGRITLDRSTAGTCFVIRLPVEMAGAAGDEVDDDA